MAQIRIVLIAMALLLPAVAVASSDLVQPQAIDTPVSQQPVQSPLLPGEEPPNPDLPLADQATTPAPEILSLPGALQQRNAALHDLPRGQDAWARPAAEGRNLAIYFRILGGREDDRLLSAGTGWASRAEFHRTTIDEAGVARMEKVETIEVPANKLVYFTPQGLHLMVIDLKRELRAGRFFPLTLYFEKAGPVRMMVNILRDPQAGHDKDSAEDAPAESMHHHMSE